MSFNNSKLLCCLLSFVSLAGCGKSDKAQDLNDGKLKTKDCVNQLSVNDSYRGTFTISRSSIVDIPTRNIESGSKRVVKLYNHTTCDSVLDSDYFFNTDSYFSVGDDTSGLQSAKGDNRIDFEVQQCKDLDVTNGIVCKGEISKDSGYFNLTVQ